MLEKLVQDLVQYYTKNFEEPVKIYFFKTEKGTVGYTFDPLFFDRLIDEKIDALYISDVKENSATTKQVRLDEIYAADKSLEEVVAAITDYYGNNAYNPHIADYQGVSHFIPRNGMFFYFYDDNTWTLSPRYFSPAKFKRDVYWTCPAGESIIIQRIMM